jgi:hypothetical protein
VLTGRSPRRTTIRARPAAPPPWTRWRASWAPPGNQVVLAWLRGGTPAIAPIVGVSTVEQLDEALDAEALALTGEQCARLDAPA